MKCAGVTIKVLFKVQVLEFDTFALSFPFKDNFFTKKQITKKTQLKINGLPYII